MYLLSHDFTEKAYISFILSHEYNKSFYLLGERPFPFLPLLFSAGSLPLHLRLHCLHVHFQSKPCILGGLQLVFQFFDLPSMLGDLTFQCSLRLLEFVNLTQVDTKIILGFFKSIRSIDGCSMVTKRDFLEMEASVWLNEKSWNGSVTKGWLSALCCWEAAVHTHD